MKKRLLLVLCLFISLVSFAQEQEPEDLQGPVTIQKNHNLLSGMDALNNGFGVKGGVNFANIYGDDTDALNASSHTNFHVGVYTQLAISKVFSFQTEGLYSRKGFENEVENRFDYLELPLLAVLNISDNFSLHLGPQFSVMIAAKQDGKEISMEDINTFDYGLAGGAETRFRMLRLGARYNLGLAEILDENDTGLPIGGDVKNSVAQLYIGIGF